MAGLHNDLQAKLPLEVEDLTARQVYEKLLDAAQP